MKIVFVLGMLCASSGLHAGWFWSSPEEAKPVVQEVAANQKPRFVASSATFAPVDTAETGEKPLFVAYSHSNEYASIANYTDSTISVYCVDKSTGAFTERPFSPVTTGTGPRSLAYSPCDGYLAVCGSGPQNLGSIHIYRSSCKKGALALLQVITQAEDPNLNQPQTIVYSPNGRFAAVTNVGADADPASDSIAIYKVSHSTGKFILPPVQQIINPAEGDRPTGLAYSPDGRFAAVTFLASGRVIVYQVDPVMGKFLNPQSQNVGFEPTSVAYSQSGKFAAVANSGSNTVSTFTVNQATGQFTPTVPATVGAGSAPQHVAYSRDDLVAAVTNRLDGSVTHYCVDPVTGNFTDPVTFPINGDSAEVYGLAFAPCSDFAAVTNSTGNLVLIFKVDSSTCP